MLVWFYLVCGVGCIYCTNVYAICRSVRSVVYNVCVVLYLSSVLLFVDEADAFLRKRSTVGIITLLWMIFYWSLLGGDQ